MAVEAEQRAWDEQGEDRNHEVFPVIVDVRHVLRANGVPLRAESALCGAAAFCGSSPLASTTPHAEPDQPGRFGHQSAADPPDESPTQRQVII